MLNKYVLESIRYEKELLDLFDGNICNALPLLSKAFEMNFYGSGYKLIVRTKNFSFKETIDFLEYIYKHKDSINYYIDRYTEAYLSILFENDYENYIILKYLSQLVAHKKKISKIENAIKYFSRLLEYVKDHLMFLNIDMFIHRLENKPYSKEKFEFLSKCILLQDSSEQYINSLNYQHKDLLCGLVIKDIDSLQTKQKFISKEFVFKNKDLWEKLFENEPVDYKKELAVILVQYGISFKIKEGKIFLTNKKYVGFCTRIFNFVKKYEEKRVGLIGIKINKEKKKKEEDIFEETEKKETVTKKGLFRKVFNKRKFLYENINVATNDTYLGERNYNVNIYIDEYNKMIDTNRIFLKSCKSDILNMSNKLDEKVKRIKEKEMIERMEQMRIEEEQRKEEAEKLQWRNQSMANAVENSDILSMASMLSGNSDHLASNRQFSNKRREFKKPEKNDDVNVDNLMKMSALLTENKKDGFKSKKTRDWNSSGKNAFNKK
ncbi:hypothetical protein EHP00_438 [Ecytonucleospora hepatopenaei]|uniref:Uncharacterized protein n=1 Tax=Ecytonucleospora hepatopenaei TaxID=646526 RepID=A0A1W0E932_9MICR|nr:hypothetical protein EHP00_438 [Ecytonucleospora hepatopenaei]